jgi:hypothetical protein
VLIRPARKGTRGTVLNERYAGPERVHRPSGAMGRRSSYKNCGLSPPVVAGFALERALRL